ncbi:tetratricopeptide repeat protein, partial [Methylocystis sp. 9N]
AQAPIDPTPTGAISAPPLSAGDAFAAIESLAAQGEASAQYEIGARLIEGRGVARDAKAAAQWFEKSAGQGVAPAQYRIGSMYEKGVGVERDYARARKWYRLAAEAGNARAMHNLAVLLAEGGEDKPDYAGAAEWFRKAAEFGVRDSQFNLAILYARGLGVSQDLKQAYVWLSAAADQGDEDAAKKRDEIGARLDSKELAAARALAGAFRPREPSREANEAPTLKSGGETIREPAFVKPAPKPGSKPKFSQL